MCPLSTGFLNKITTSIILFTATIVALVQNTMCSNLATDNDMQFKYKKLSSTSHIMQANITSTSRSRVECAGKCSRRPSGLYMYFTFDHQTKSCSCGDNIVSSVSGQTLQIYYLWSPGCELLVSNFIFLILETIICVLNCQKRM